MAPRQYCLPSPHHTAPSTDIKTLDNIAVANLIPFLLASLNQESPCHTTQYYQSTIQLRLLKCLCGSQYLYGGGAPFYDFFYGKKMQGTGGKDMEGTSNTVDVVVVEEHFQNL